MFCETYAHSRWRQLSSEHVHRSIATRHELSKQTQMVAFVQVEWVKGERKRVALHTTAQTSLGLCFFHGIRQTTLELMLPSADRSRESPDTHTHTHARLEAIRLEIIEFFQHDTLSCVWVCRLGRHTHTHTHTGVRQHNRTLDKHWRVK